MMMGGKSAMSPTLLIAVMERRKKKPSSLPHELAQGNPFGGEAGKHYNEREDE